jgi:Ca-activated chloride channel homolog
MRHSRTSGSCVFLCLFAVVGCGGVVDPNAASKFSADSSPPPGAAFLTRDDAADHASNTEAYERIVENRFLNVRQQPLSTFSIDVDSASYSNVRRFLQQRQLPPADAVRIEELINYFPYNYPEPDGADPFAVHIEVAGCPWNDAHRLARIGIQGKHVAESQRPAANLVFLLDVSGSMNHPKKLPLVKESMRMLVGQLGENDHLAIVAYAGAAGVVLPSTSATQRARILNAIDHMQPGGSTNGALGIRVAYEIAAENFQKSGINRVILCTDGDFNVGITDQTELTRLIETQAKTGVFLSVLGFGMGNLKDSTMEHLADRGNGNYAYIDGLAEAKKVLVNQMSGTLITIAKDVKIQVEFNPAQVSGYRLIGYENRRLADRDFRDDTKDAGEIGAGHSVTALYEIVPAGVALSSKVAPTAGQRLKYQPDVTEETLPAVRPVDATQSANSGSDELLTVKLRFKQPDGDASQEREFAVSDRGTAFSQSSGEFRFAAAVAQFGMLLRSSQFGGNSTFDSVLATAEAACGDDPNGYRSEFLQLVKLARGLSGEKPAREATGD